jgi:hypothetical protein
MDSSKKAIKDRIDSMTIEQAREFVATYHGSKGSEYHSFAEDCLAAKEAALRDLKDAESLSISREALSNSRRANKIAISAMILSIATAIGIAIFQWLTKN